MDAMNMMNMANMVNTINTVNAMNPVCRKENVFEGMHYRISVITEGLLRLEYSDDGTFEDRATQTVWNRKFPAAEFAAERGCKKLRITTRRLRLEYDEKRFSPEGLSITVTGDDRFPGREYDVWHFGEAAEDLGGTARTLDGADGPCPLGHGVISRKGYALLDDSHSLAVTEDGWVEPRREGICDLYFWGYGHDYKRCLQDFQNLCGNTPMLPRFALGNWWSRFYAYTEKSYRALMERFAGEQLPFSVAVIDMDWHLVDIDPEYGSGWTGYTWNRELFPDPSRFLQWLHDRGMRVTLNVHPADGVRAFEEHYPEMAQALGIDPETKTAIPFDPGSRKFMDAYLTKLHHPMEREGVDFWWVDWQQGTDSRMEGLDPLWMLNHLHFLDSGREGKRPITFSRYAGPGSHRYPIGFSGDTIISWKSLDFQPYFTATAGNIGYNWWSHDIGGHIFAAENDICRQEELTADEERGAGTEEELGELLVRWLQFGVFSPINRLHSSKGLSYHKEPWFYDEEKRKIMGEFLRLRHQLVPYLYTMNARCHRTGEPLIQPMYYSHPEQEEAYQVPNQYWFGTELLAAPVTRPVNPSTHMAETDMWLPEGIWFDFFTGEIFEGGKRVQMHRGIRSLPVLAKAGAIIPMTEEIFGADFLKNPGKLILRVYDGSDGAFRLYEDDNETQDYLDGVCAMTEIVWKHEKKELHILPVQGDRRLVPEQRDYEIEWYIPADNGAACIKRFSLHEVSAGLGITVVLEG